MSRVCNAGCGRALGPRNASGLCRSCFTVRLNERPERAERASMSMRAKFDDPDYRARHARWVRRGAFEAMQRPEFVEMRRQQGHALQRRGDGYKPVAGTPDRIQAGRTHSNTTLRWCPPGWRDDYRQLVKRKGVPAARAREIIEREFRTLVERLNKRERLSADLADRAREARRYLAEIS